MASCAWRQTTTWIVSTQSIDLSGPCVCAHAASKWNSSVPEWNTKSHSIYLQSRIPYSLMLGGSRHLDVYSLGLSSLVWARQISNFRNQFVIFEGYWFQYTDTVWVTFSGSQNISGDVGKLPRAEDVALFSQPQLHPAHKKHNQRHHQRAPLDATTAGTAHNDDDLIWWSALADTPPHNHAF